ncbi:MAG: c-type cytochrome [gamma proteobacterium endosymbiont of Lamellibrachia anaximandri]|nr:c-type cytochrome [gamma proteobacterium endosymbiont of Lamellibrachia anaximandri]MBL3617489.1 c-type cytochrome [gamma proteobacterium endosymbiont of Lamellibrachia anaximandri]
MNTGIIELLAFGMIAIIAGVFLLVSMIRELTSTERHKWFLGIGLSTGIIAFSLKIGLIIVFSMFPGPMLALFPEREYEQVLIPGPSERELRSAPGKGSYTWKALPESAPFPRDNLPSLEKIALGKRLFFDKRLSADDSLSCASCHEISVEKGGSDGLPASIGINGQHGNRNAPTVLNAAFQQVLFWDGRAASLEDQAKGPLVNPIEMGMPSLESVVEKVRKIPEYKEIFSQAFAMERPITIDNIAKAIATYERTLITPDSPYDRFVRGDSSALSEKQIRGMALFESTGCIQCHSGPNFSGASVFGDNTPYRIFPAVPHTEFEIQHHLSEDLGAAYPTKDSDRGIWRIPSLRNINRTSPYFHNGSVESLKEAVRIMARVQLNKKLSNSNVDDKSIQWSETDSQFSVSEHQALSDTEVDEIVAFLQSLDGELPTHFLPKGVTSFQ